MMEVLVNGASVDVEVGVTVSGLLAHLRISQDHVAVEVNREVVPREDLLQRELGNGDRVEVVTFVGGG